MTRKLFVLVVLVAFIFGLGKFLAAYPSKSTLGWGQLIWGWSENSGITVPIAANATTGALLVDLSSGTVSLTASGQLDIRVSSETAVVGFTRTTEVTISSTPQLLASLTGRIWVVVQNKAATESCWVNPGGTTATPGYGLEVKAGDVLERNYGPGITLPIVCTTTAAIAHNEER